MHTSIFHKAGAVIFLALAAFLPGMPASVMAAGEDAVEQVNTPRYVLRIDKECSAEKASMDLAALTQRASAILDATTEEVSQLLGVQPSQKVVLRFMSATAFYSQTKAPRWTTGMFYHDEIVIPISAKANQDEELTRTLRHEYVHAVVAELSGHRSPAWLDEGLAQMIEGPPSAALSESLRQWLRGNQTIPLQTLQRGFTRLRPESVPAAYAESLAAVNLLARQSGIGAIVRYLRLLAENEPEPKAFTAAFKQSPTRFETALSAALAADLKTGRPLF